MKTPFPTNLDPDVLVVGAGPTGSTLALDLARRGVKVRILDRNSHGFQGSRAKGLQPRSLEVLEDLGALKDILIAGSTYPPLGLHIGPFTIPKRMLKITEPTDDIPYPNTWLIPQFSTDSIIQGRLALEGVSVEYDTELTSLSQDAAGVTAVIRGPSGPATLRARYLVGADGGSSRVRQELGIAFPGKTDEADRMIIVDCRIEGLGRNRWHIWPSFGGRFVAACPLPNGDLFQVMIRLKPGEEPKLDPDSLNDRVRRQTRSRKLRLHDIRWSSVYRPNIRLAERYSQGRVFLAGDAAHVHTPMGAQGLNTGIQDAYNLGWKLGQVIAGAPTVLLDSYESERRPIAAGVLGMSTAKYEALDKLDPSSIRRGKDERQLSINYRGGPLALSAAAVTTTLRVGDRAPDARLRDPAGNPLRLFDVLRGPHFTLLAYGPSAARDLAAVAWPRAGATLRRVAINGPPDAPADLRIRDEGGSFRSNYGAGRAAQVLIRPDGYIAQIATTDFAASVSRVAALVAPPQAQSD